LRRNLKKDLAHLTLDRPFRPELISESVSYASMYWTDHVCRSKGFDAELIYTFLSGHLLEWMEILSALGKFRFAIRCIEGLRKLDLHVRYRRFWSVYLI
jgi:hypothetical protein